jgi:hypothetical protein
MAVVLRSGFIDDLHSRVHRNHLNNSSYLGFPMISNAQVDRLIAELRTHRPDLPSRDRLLSFVLSRLCLSILCGYEADVSTRQLQESHYAMSTASIING